MIRQSHRRKNSDEQSHARFIVILWYILSLLCAAFLFLYWRTKTKTKTSPWTTMSEPSSAQESHGVEETFAVVFDETRWWKDIVVAARPLAVGTILELPNSMDELLADPGVRFDSGLFSVSTCGVMIPTTTCEQVANLYKTYEIAAVTETNIRRVAAASTASTFSVEVVRPIEENGPLLFARGWTEWLIRWYYELQVGKQKATMTIPAVIEYLQKTPKFVPDVQSEVQRRLVWSEKAKS
jgi:hypothetical protein